MICKLKIVLDEECKKKKKVIKWLQLSITDETNRFTSRPPEMLEIAIKNTHTHTHKQQSNVKEDNRLKWSDFGSQKTGLH